MKKKICGYVPTGHINAVCKHEAIDQYENIFSKYFDIMGNCIVNQDLSGVTNSIFCYTKVNKLQCNLCLGGIITIDDEWDFSPEDTVWEHIHLNAKVPSFIRVETKDYEKRLCDNSIIISLKGKGYNRVVGEFCPIKQILIASDWTHDSKKIQFVEKLFARMEKEGLISAKKMENIKPKITLGTDPEFEYIDRDTDEIINCREMGIRDRVPIVPGGEGRIGRDGAGAQRELRPEPSDTPEGLIKNIEKLIVQGLDEKWSLRGEKFSCGGHIHIGGVSESRNFVNILDYYLSPLFVLNSKIRNDSPYGKPGSQDAMRKQPHGIEYRVPPVGWLASKELARITLKIVKICAEKHYSGEDLEIGDNIEDDLITLGLSKSEMETYFSEIRKYKSTGLPNDLKVAWGYKIPPKFVIEFRDNWDESVKIYIENEIRDMFMAEQLSGNIVFYGLSHDRGNVFSTVVSNMKGIDLPEDYGIIPPVKGNKNHVGIPHSVRASVAETTRIISLIKNIVKRTINPPKKKNKDIGPATYHSENSEIIPEE